MSQQVALDDRLRSTLGSRLTARLAVAIARLLTPMPIRRIRRILCLARRGARPATPAEALRSRQAVVGVSIRCAGPRCLQRAIATALLCRMRGTWPTWCTGVRTSPFRAHAWVEVDGEPIDEPQDAGYYVVNVTVPPYRQ
jgi:hypothetical protein